MFLRATEKRRDASDEATVRLPLRGQLDAAAIARSLARVVALKRADGIT